MISRQGACSRNRPRAGAQLHPYREVGPAQSSPWHPTCWRSSPRGGTLGYVTAVDPDDDSIRRYVVRLYAYDPDRRERRHRVVAAVDNEAEWRRLLDELSSDWRRRRAEGQLIDTREHITGVVLEPNHARRQRDARLLHAAIRPRVAISEEFLERLDLPRGVFVRSHRPHADPTAES